MQRSDTGKARPQAADQLLHALSPALSQGAQSESFPLRLPDHRIVLRPAGALADSQEAPLRPISRLGRIAHRQSLFAGSYFYSAAGPDHRLLDLPLEAVNHWVMRLYRISVQPWGSWLGD